MSLECISVYDEAGAHNRLIGVTYVTSTSAASSRRVARHARHSNAYREYDGLVGVAVWSQSTYNTYSFTYECSESRLCLPVWMMNFASTVDLM